MKVVCYPQPNKGRSRDILRRFAAGSGGRVQFDPPAKLEDGAAAFFGVVGIEHLLNQARNEGRPYFYLDNSFFDVTRKTMTRVGVNALQDMGTGTPDWARFKALGIEVKSWTNKGRHIVLCEQSPHFMSEVCHWGRAKWCDVVQAELRKHTDRPIIVRAWSSDKGERSTSLQMDLKGAWALVAHTSAAANEALLAGIPVFLTGPGAARTMGNEHLSDIESPRRPDGREEWSAALARVQFTLDELGNGHAWNIIRDEFQRRQP